MATDERVRHIAIAGTGLIGASWAAFYASRGFPVKMFDVSEESCRSGHLKALAYLASLKELGEIDEAVHATAVDSIQIAGNVRQLVQDARLVQESVTERYDVKDDLFGKLEAHADSSCVFASSSSGLLVSQIQKDMKHPGRFIIAHPFNPPHLIPLVELVPGDKTDAAVLKSMIDFFKGLGKVPIVLRKEVPGHVANRLQAALWREAIQLVISGVADVEDVDKAVSAGLGLRWALMGQHMIFHLGGGEGGIGSFVDHIGASFEKLWEDMADWHTLPAETKQTLVAGVEAEMHGREAKEMTQWRDKKLVALMRTIRD